MRGYAFPDGSARRSRVGMRCVWRAHPLARRRGCRRGRCRWIRAPSDDDVQRDARHGDAVCADAVLDRHARDLRAPDDAIDGRGRQRTVLVSRRSDRVHAPASWRVLRGARAPSVRKGTPRGVVRLDDDERARRSREAPRVSRAASVAAGRPFGKRLFRIDSHRHRSRARLAREVHGPERARRGLGRLDRLGRSLRIGDRARRVGDGARRVRARLRKGFARDTRLRADGKLAERRRADERDHATGGDRISSGEPRLRDDVDRSLVRARFSVRKIYTTRTRLKMCR